MNLTKDRITLQNFHEAVRYEWLETNGLGGFAGSSIIGCNNRRYHGLLIASMKPPAERIALVSKLDETIIIGEEKFELACNNYGEVISPEGNKFQESFSKKLFPEFVYHAGGVELKKTIAMIHGENTTLIIYEVIRSEYEFVLELLPLISVRDYHSLMHANDSLNRNADFRKGVLKIQAYDSTPEIFIYVPHSTLLLQPEWYFHFHYEIEKYRGLDFSEDLFSHGKFLVNLKEGDTLGIILSTKDPEERNAVKLFTEEKRRRTALMKGITKDKTVETLVLAADQFIVQRGENLKTVIAGYHWFTDWGRDTMIALPGLCLSTKRFDDAKKILEAFAKSVSMGMLPNRFPDHGEAPEYNNVDGTLWYFVAVYRYLLASDDEDFVLNQILPVLKDIIEWYCKGTRYHIHVDADDLLISGEPGVQLTWMDAKVGGWVVTPRTGKAVEVNALWYNALCIYGELLEMHDEKKEAKKIDEKARRVKKHFEKLFWNEELGFLYDVLNKAEKDPTLRPNQLFALGICFPLIEGEKAKKIFTVVKEKLFTPAGLRTLSPDHPDYKGVYGGNQAERDAAYHQGTVWFWLLGIYIDAIMKLGGKSSKKEAMQVIENFKYHLEEVCIGSISEIFDGDSPHTPRGCIAQAWSVAEILRVMTDYKLYTIPKKKTASEKAAKQKGKSLKAK